MSITQPSLLLGELLVQRGLVSAEHVTKALAEQSKTPDQAVGQILVRLGHLSERDLAQVLELSGKRRSLQEILLSRGVVDARRLATAEDAARNQGMRLEGALVRLRYATEAQV